MANSMESAFDRAKSEIFFLRWIFGWNLLVGWLMVMFLVGGVGYFLRLPYLFGLVGFVLGLPVWYLGTQYINEHAEALRDGYLADVETFGPKVLRSAGAPGDAETYVLVVWPETAPFKVDFPKQYAATVLAVGDEAVWIYNETSLDMMFMSGTIGTDTDEVERVAFADLESVAEADRAVELHRTDDEPIIIPCASDPSEAIEAIRDRLATETAD